MVEVQTWTPLENNLGLKTKNVVEGTNMEFET
jgi:hypothetical protein